jgi:CDP-paratose 2-epimerase
VDHVIHLAGQVAVTTSVADPRMDFESNALGTLNVLEGLRTRGLLPVVIYSSTNKVYGRVDALSPTVLRDGRYDYERLPNGVDEHAPLDFYSPYGCSKGAGDQYVRDYARVFGLPTVVLRQSCIYGPRQMGLEDQGWVVWFIISQVLGRQLTIFGDGRQVRDILYVDDLLDCYEAAIANIERARGNVYNIGGGPGNRLSLLELIALLEEMSGEKIDHRFADWRPGDQKVFVCDVRRAGRDLRWQPRTDLRTGLRALYDWVVENKPLFKHLLQ